MATFTRDIKYEKATELIKKLEGEEGELIRYYISINRDYASKLQRQIDEMQSVFYGIKKFI